MKIRLFLIDSFKATLALLYYLIEWFPNKNRKKIWLIGERPGEAKDNGFHFYKYVREEHPNDDIYYIIEKDSKHLSRVDTYGKVIFYNSFKHYYYFFKSELIILPFERSTFPRLNLIWYYYRLGLLRKKTVFLQHGITKELQKHYAYGNRFKFDLFVCAAQKECDFVISNMNYTVDNAKALGFPRFDNLSFDSTSNDIFFMPTWRQWMKDYTEDEFLNSTYCQEINNLLKNEIFISFIEERDIYIKLYLHDIFQKYSKLITSTSKNVCICSSSNYDVQELMINSHVMITDYSSVAFDFAYMNKLVFYYQFDKADYYARHFQKGYFDCDQHGFGPVLENSAELVDSIMDYYNNEPYLHYINRVKEFYGEKTDRNNSLRVYKAVKELF